MRRLSATHMVCAFAWALAGAVGLQTAQAQEALRTSLRACAALEDGAERLGCFDRVVARLDGESDPVATAAGPSASPPEKEFGITLRQKGAPQLDSITAQVTALRELADGSTLIELDNGQTWRHVNDGRSLLLRVGDTVTISRAALGSFRLVTPSRRFARVRRVD